MTKTETKIAEAAAELAAQVLTPAALPSFLALPLKDQLTGIAVFATMANDSRIKAQALEALEALETAEDPPVIELYYGGRVDTFRTVEAAREKAQQVAKNKTGSDIWVDGKLIETRFSSGRLVVYPEE